MPHCKPKHNLEFYFTSILSSEVCNNCVETLSVTLTVERHTSSVYLICSLISHPLNSLSMSCIHLHPGICDQELSLNSFSSPNCLTDCMWLLWTSSAKRKNKIGFFIFLSSLEKKSSQMITHRFVLHTESLFHLLCCIY